MVNAGTAQASTSKQPPFSPTSLQPDEYRLLFADSQDELNAKDSYNASAVHLGKESCLESAQNHEASAVSAASPSKDLGNLDSVANIPSLNQAPADGSNAATKTSQVRQAAADSNNAPANQMGQEGRLHAKGRLLESGQVEIRAVVNAKAPPARQVTHGTEYLLEPARDEIKIVDLPKFAYAETGKKNESETDGVGARRSVNETERDAQEAGQVRGWNGGPSPIRGQLSPDQSEPTEPLGVDDEQDDGALNLAGTISNIVHTDADDWAEASPPPLDTSNAQVLQVQPLLKDQIHNLTHIPNNGYNDFFWYMDKAPRQDKDRRKQAVRDLNKFKSNKRRREHIMQERRRFLLRQVQYALDSSRAAESFEESRAASKVSGHEPERSFDAAATFDRALADSEAAVRQEDAPVLQDLEKEAQQPKGAGVQGGPKTPSPLLDGDGKKKGAGGQANLKFALAPAASLSPVPQIGLVVCNEQGVEERSPGPQHSAELGDRATLYGSSKA